MTRFASAPERYWHCYFGKDGEKQASYASALDMTKDELLRGVVVPWRQGREFSLNGRVIQNRGEFTAVKVVRTDRGSPYYEKKLNDELSSGPVVIMSLAGVGFAVFRRGNGEDFTNELLFDPAPPEDVDARSFLQSDLKILNDDMVALNARILGPAIMSEREWHNLVDDTLVSIEERLAQAVQAPHSKSVDEYHKLFVGDVRRFRSFVDRTLRPALEDGVPDRRTVVAFGEAVSTALTRMHNLVGDASFGQPPVKLPEMERGASTRSNPTARRPSSAPPEPVYAGPVKLNVRKQVAIETLRKAVDGATALAALDPPSMIDPGFDRWERGTRATLRNIFGEKSPQFEDFTHIPFSAMVLGASPQEFRKAVKDGLVMAVSHLETVISEIETFAPDDTPQPQPVRSGGSVSRPDPKKVFVIHGRNLAAVREMNRFLRALGLDPINFGELRATLGGTATIADVVFAGMEQAQGVIALFTGDEFAFLRPEHREKHDDGAQISRWQSRPNVIFEAGMAFGRDRDRVVFVLLGKVELFTDVAGIHIFRPTNSSHGARDTLRRALKASLHCDTNDSSAWMTEGDFETCIVAGPDPRDPFAQPGA